MALREELGREAYVEVASADLHTVPASLADHPIFSRKDLAVTQSLLARLWGKTTLVATGDPAPACLFYALELPGLVIGHLDLHVGAALSWKQQRTSYTCLTPSLTSLEYRISGRTGQISPLEMLIVNPGEEVSLTMSAYCPVSVIRIEAAAMRSVLASMRQVRWSGPLVLESQVDLTSGAALRYSAALGLIHSESLAEGSLLSQGVGAEQMSQFFISSLLWMQGEQMRQHFVSLAQGASMPLRKATNYIREHVSEEMTLADIANAAGVSVRHVQKLFKEHFGQRPREYIRALRLDGAHRDLLASDVTQASVAHIATEWGWNSPSYFSAQYFQRFGRYPHETLARHELALGEVASERADIA